MRVYTLHQAARAVGILYYQAWRLAKAGKFKHLKASRSILIDESELPAMTAAAIEAGFTTTAARKYDDFEEALATIGLGSDLCPLTNHQKEHLFDWFRNSHPRPDPVTFGPAIEPSNT